MTSETVTVSEKNLTHSPGTPGQVMRAVQLARYGGPERLVEATVAVPTPPTGCVLIRVAATSVNPVDLLARRGLLRIATGFTMPLGTGRDYSGQIVEVAADVAASMVGTAVWGFLGLPRQTTAAAAEFVVARVGTFAAAPTTIDLVDAAALPLVASTALVALRDHLRLAEGQRLLVRGGAGGVGTAAIQLGTAIGASVTALVGARDLDFVRKLGAATALDYRTHTPEQLGRFDAILDTTGSGLLAYQRLLAAHGRIVSTAVGGFAYAGATVLLGNRRIRTFGVIPHEKDLSELAGYVDRGELRPIIDTVRPLSEIGDAHRALEAGGTRGKHVVSL